MSRNPIWDSQKLSTFNHKKTHNYDIKLIQFGTLSSSEWELYASCEVTAPRNVDKNQEGTPYDLRLGTIDRELCESCGGDNKTCPGHFGYIRLPIHIYNRTYTDFILKILQCVCHNCSKPRITRESAEILDLLKYKGLERLKNFTRECSKIRECSHCNEILFSFEFNKIDFIRRLDKKDKNSPSLIFEAGECLNVFSRIDDDTINLLGFNDSLSENPLYYVYDEYAMVKKHIHRFRPENLIFTNFPVIPPISRPYVIRDGKKHDDDITGRYDSIIKKCKTIYSLIDKINNSHGDTREKLEISLKKDEAKLKNFIWTLMNSKNDHNKFIPNGHNLKCLKKRIEGKEGRINYNICGKRVNFSSRTVIGGGGILLKGTQLGIPFCVAKELTKEELVNELNISEMKELLFLGKVNKVKRGRKVIRLNALPDGGKMFKLRLGDKIERQLRSGDIVLFNRQPTLRPEGMIAFEVVPIEGRIFRLNLLFTTGLNADFDGTDTRRQQEA